MMKLCSLRNILYFCFITVAAAPGLGGCYSFTGASVPQHWKTIAVPLFDDESNSGEPGLREQLTNAIIQKVQRDNTLQIADRSTASVVMVGSITALNADEPVAVTSGEKGTRFRVRLTLKVTLLDRIQKKQVWEKQFSDYGEYSATSGASQRQTGLLAAIDKLSDTIVLETVSGW